MAKKEHKHIYNSGRWHRLRVRKLCASPLCEYCPPDSRRPAVEVDHKKAISDGGDPWKWENLASVCSYCHKVKTGKGERLHGCDEHGNPRDAAHWWYEKKLRKGY